VRHHHARLEAGLGGEEHVQVRVDAPVEQVGAAFFYAATGRTVRPVDLLDEAALTALVTGDGAAQ
jgi:hypothetical protein